MGRLVSNEGGQLLSKLIKQKPAREHSVYIRGRMRMNRFYGPVLECSDNDKNIGLYIFNPDDKYEVILNDNSDVEVRTRVVNDDYSFRKVYPILSVWAENRYQVNVRLYRNNL